MKKLSKITTCAMALGLALTFSACATPESANTPTSSQTPTSNPIDSLSAEQVISERYETFLHDAYTIDSDKLTAFANEYADVTAEPTIEQKNKIIASMVELLPVLSYLDTEGLNIDDIASTYGAVLGLGALANGSTIAVTVPLEAVIVDGEKATIDITQLQIMFDGSEANSSESSGEPVKFVLKNNEWLIDPSGLSL